MGVCPQTSFAAGLSVDDRAVPGFHRHSLGVTKDSLGRWGEDFAAVHLATLGWTILDRNWRCRAGELDIVALEPGPPPCLVAVEVKTKAGPGFGDPLEAITVAKVARLGRLALWWQRCHRGVPERLRLDAVGVTKLAGQAPQLRHVRGLS